MELYFAGSPYGKKKTEFPVPDLVSPEQLHTGLMKSSSPRINEKVVTDISNYERSCSVSPINSEIQTPSAKLDCNVTMRGCRFTSPVGEEAQTPFMNLMDNSCSEDLHLTSGGKSDSVERRRKFKRLRKIGDCGNNRNLKRIKENFAAPIANLARSFSNGSPVGNKHARCMMYPIADFNFGILFNYPI